MVYIWIVSLVGLLEAILSKDDSSQHLADEIGATAPIHGTTAPPEADWKNNAEKSRATTQEMAPQCHLKQEDT